MIKSKSVQRFEYSSLKDRRNNGVTCKYTEVGTGNQFGSRGVSFIDIKYKCPGSM
jgi:hypothetical protein